jgi:nitroimidazol reductase NimA-like FMN-containing flavoprotein (pyridoxamine 5'-phosphate oxidase superfamily)
MTASIIEDVNRANKTRKVVLEMTADEISQFLFCARVGRVGISLEDGPYILPVGYGYGDNKIFFHSCYTGLKMEGIKKNPNVCFQVDESLSDISMYKSVVIKGEAKVIEDEEEMVPFLQALIDKYRVPVSFDEYIGRSGRSREKEIAVVRIVVITPIEVSGRSMIRVNPERIK